MLLYAQYDWMTGESDNGNQWRKFRVMPRLHPLRPLVVVLCVLGMETEGLSDYQGRAGIMSIVRWNLCPVIFGEDASVAGFRKRCFWQTVVFVPYRKQVVLTKNGENDDILQSSHKNIGVALLRPRRPTKMTKMAGVPVGQTGVYRPVSPSDFLLFAIGKLTKNGRLCRDTGRVSQGQPGVQEVFGNFM